MEELILLNFIYNLYNKILFRVGLTRSQGLTLYALMPSIISSWVCYTTGRKVTWFIRGDAVSFNTEGYIQKTNEAVQIQLSNSYTPHYTTETLRFKDELTRANSILRSRYFILELKEPVAEKVFLIVL